MILYHGSPHRFDAFDLSFVSTGEGFQTYGHGVYLAAALPAAESYGECWRMLIDLDIPLAAQPEPFRELCEPIVDRLPPLRRHLIEVKSEGSPKGLAVAALAVARRKGDPIEPMLQAHGFKGFTVFAPKLESQIFTALRPDDLSIINVRTLH